MPAGVLKMGRRVGPARLAPFRSHEGHAPHERLHPLRADDRVARPRAAPERIAHALGRHGFAGFERAVLCDVVVFNAVPATPHGLLPTPTPTPTQLERVRTRECSGSAWESTPPCARPRPEY